MIHLSPVTSSFTNTAKFVYFARKQAYPIAVSHSCINQSKPHPSREKTNYRHYQSNVKASCGKLKLKQP